MRNIFILVSVIIFFVGCGSREYFEPSQKEVSKPIYLDKHIGSEIIFFTKDVATLSNYKTLPSNTQLPKGFVALSDNLSKKGNILRVNDKNITFNKLIVTANKKNNLVAILFGDNHFELYDLTQNKTISTLKFDPFLALRKFVAKPYFYKSLLLIPTLDGKMVIYDLNENKMIRSVVVSQKDYFNNIIYLGVKDDNLIVASRDNLIVIAPNMVMNKKYNIKHILVDDYIYVFTIEGRIIKLDFNLKVIKEKEFKYANILAPMIYNNNIYFISRGDKGFLIKIDKSLKTEKIIPLKIMIKDEYNPFYDKEKEVFLKTNIFSNNGVFYIGDYELKVK